MGFCPVPHLFRDRVWLCVGIAIGAGATYLMCRRDQKRKNVPVHSSKSNAPTSQLAKSVDLDVAADDTRKRWLEGIDCFIFDCDGVVWSGGSMIPGADKAIATLKRLGKQVMFVTNNSSKAQSAFKAKFDKFNIKVNEAELVSSGHSTAKYLIAAGFSGKKIYVVGEPGLHQTLRDHGMETLGKEDYNKSGEDFNGATVAALAKDDVAAVVVGFCNKFNYYMLTRAMIYIRNHGALYVTTNQDAQAPLLPDDRTLIPGNGSATAALTTAVGREPVCCGKPSTTLANLIMPKSVHASRACVVGDRLDTDIALGKSIGMQTLLLKSGVTEANVAAQMVNGTYSGPHQPTHVANSIAILDVK